MTSSAYALLGYVGWTLILIVVTEVFRTFLVLSGRKAADSFRPDGSDISPFAHRLARAHANCYESFPIIGGVLLLVLATDQTAVTDPSALWVLAARVAQSSVHVVFSSSLAVQIRFTFFALQLSVVAYWVIRLAMQ